MIELRGYLVAALLSLGASALTQAQTAAPRAEAPRAPTAPGVTRAIEHPDRSADQTKPDERQPETAVDPPNSSGPETARDDSRLQPETATDAPKTSPTQKAADQAKQGVRSNSPPAAKPPG